MDVRDDILLPELLPDLLRGAAASHANRLALASRGWLLNFGDVHARTNALAHALVARGARRGQAVVIYGRGSVQTTLALWAALKANATAVIVPAHPGLEALRAAMEARQARVLVTEARLMGDLAPLGTGPGTLEHVLVCGAVEADQMPALPGTVSAVAAMEGQIRRVPPMPESLPGDVAFVTLDGGVLRPHTHRQVMTRLPPGPCSGDETHPVGLLWSATGIDRMLGLFRDGATLRFVPTAAQAPVAHPPRTP